MLYSRITRKRNVKKVGLPSVQLFPIFPALQKHAPSVLLHMKDMFIEQLQFIAQFLPNVCGVHSVTKYTFIITLKNVKVAFF